MCHSWQDASMSPLSSLLYGVNPDSATQVQYSERENLLFHPEPSGSWIDVLYRPHGDAGSASHSGIRPTLVAREKIVDLGQLRQFTATFGSSTDLSDSMLSPKSSGSVKIFFIRQKHSFSRLSISRELFDSLLSECKVFGRFKEFALSFGIKVRENDIAPPTCSIQVNGIASEGQFASFECAYGLRYVVLNGKKDDREPWSIRQMAVYQRYDQDASSCTWIVIAAPRSIENRMEAYTVNCDPFISNPLEFHVALFETALANWRWYIADLMDQTVDQSDRVVLASVAHGKLSVVQDFEINFTDRQQLKILEDRAIDGLVVLDSTAETISNIRDQVTQTCSAPSPEQSQVIHRLSAQLSEVQTIKNKMKALHKKIQGTASLLSDLLNYENAQIGHGNEVSLRDLAQEAHAENTVMRVLTEKGTRDAAAVKALTVITLIYLPSTVITNFFSSQFVSTQEGKGGAISLVVSKNVWLFAATTVPLTLVTLAIWYCWVRMQPSPNLKRKMDVEKQVLVPASSPKFGDSDTANPNLDYI